MKKKTVITTEKHEVWVVREAVPEPLKDQPFNNAGAIDLPPTDHDSQEPAPRDIEEET